MPAISSRLGRICLFLQDLAGGGAERMILHLAEGMAERGHPLDLVLVRPEGPYMSHVPGNVRMIPLDCTRTASSIWPLARYLRAEKPVAMLSALAHVNIAAILAVLVARSGTRLVISERNTISFDAHSSSSFPIRMAHRLVPILYRKADAVVAVSKGVANDLAAYARLPLQRIDVINNPVITPQFAALSRECPKHPWLTLQQPPVILGVGRLSPQKDFSTLIEAFAIVNQRRSARLLILGEGPCRAELEDLASRLNLADSVAMPGFIENPYAYMFRAAVFALSSRWEGSPNALVEAMACGTPVVATDCESGPREILQDGRLGHLVPVADARGLAEGLLDTLARPPCREALIARGRDFTVDRAVDGYLDVLLGASR